MQRVITLGVILVMVAATAFATPMTGKFELGAGGGLNIPTGDIGDGLNNGYAFTLNAGFKPIPNLVVGGEFGYYGNGATDEVLAGLGSNADANMSMMQFTAMAKYMVPVLEVHNAYAKAVAGAYNNKMTIENSTSGNLEASDTNLGMGVGAGFRFNAAPRSSVFVEGMFHHINGEVDSAQMFAFSAGVTVSLP